MCCRAALDLLSKTGKAGTPALLAKAHIRMGLAREVLWGPEGRGREVQWALCTGCALCLCASHAARRAQHPGCDAPGLGLQRPFAPTMSSKQSQPFSLRNLPSAPTAALAFSP